MELHTIFPFRSTRARRTPVRWRLFCLPFAGGNAAIYRPWTAAFGDEIEVCPVELPGHGQRFGVPFVRRMDDLTADLLPAVRALGDVPAAFFGHSLGGLVAQELAVATKARHLFVSAVEPPDRPPRRLLAHLPRDTFLRELTALGAMPPEVAAERELMDLFEPILRADVALGEEHRAAPRSLGCPITAFAGAQDPEVDLAEAGGWARFTTSTFRLVTLDEGHAYLDTARDRLTQEIATALASER